MQIIQFFISNLHSFLVLVTNQLVCRKNILPKNSLAGIVLNRRENSNKNISQGMESIPIQSCPIQSWINKPTFRH